MNELFKRILVAILGIPLAVIIVYAGDWYLVATIAVISSIALYEYYKIAEKKHCYPHLTKGILAGILLFIIFQLFPFFTAVIYSFILVILFTLFTMLVEMWSKKPNTNLNIAITLTGFLYIPFSFLFLILTRNFYQLIQYIRTSTIDFVSVEDNFFRNADDGAWLLLSIFISIWICDSAAYFIGKAIGKHKLFERISPKKTWEGAVAGFVFAIISFWGASELLLHNFPYQHVIVIGAIVGIFGQMGDLAESQLKRDASVKDSSAILPGHGGILDRFDSILFVVPIVFIYLFFRIVSF